MKDLRAKFFFWLGVFVLPIFWSWFTLLSKGFSTRQRGIAFAWLGIYIAAAAWNGSVVISYLHLLPFGYPLVIGWLTLALWAWLFFRVCPPADLLTWFFLGLIFICEVLHPILETIDSLVFKGPAFSFYWLFWPLIPAVLHCLVDPLKRLIVCDSWGEAA